MMHRKSVITGSLRFMGIADLFQIFGGNNSSGMLLLNSPHSPHTGRIYFVNGNPVNASNGSLQGIDAAYSIFGWLEGEFEFKEERVQVPHVIQSTRMEIVLDALRMLDDGLIKKAGPSFSGDSSNAKKNHSSATGTLPVIRVPIIDYNYIIDEEEFDDGSLVVKEGGQGKWLWVVLDGTVKITKEVSEKSTDIALLGEGCLIGSLTSLLIGECARSATVTSVGKVQLGVLDTERLHREFKRLSPPFKALLRSLDGRLRKITEKAVDLVTKRKKEADPSKNRKLILKKGTSHAGIFAITKGETYVMGETASGSMPLLTLGKKEIFGGFPFVDMGQEPRRASVYASRDLTVKKLNPQKLLEEFDQLSKTTKTLIANHANCVSMTTRMACHLNTGKGKAAGAH